MTRCIVSLCDRTGNMLRPWADAGWECWAVDVQHGIRRDYAEREASGNWRGDDGRAIDLDLTTWAYRELEQRTGDLHT